MKKVQNHVGREVGCSRDAVQSVNDRETCASYLNLTDSDVGRSYMLGLFGCTREHHEVTCWTHQVARRSGCRHWRNL